MLRRFEGHTNGVTSVCFSPDGRHVLSGSGDNTIRLWEVESGKVLRLFEGHTSALTSVCFSPDGRYVLSGSMGGVILFEVKSGKELRRFEDRPGGADSVSFSPDGRYFLSGYNCLRLWEVHYPEKDWGEIHPYPLLSRVKSVAKLGIERERIGELLISARGSMGRGSFHEACRLLREAQSVSGYERDREVLDLMALCGSKGKGRRSGLRGAWSRHTFESSSRILSVSFSPDSRYAFSMSNLTVNLWEVGSGKGLTLFKGKGHIGSAVSISFFPDGRYILRGSGDTIHSLWEHEDITELIQLEGHISLYANYETCLSPDDRYILDLQPTITVRDALNEKVLTPDDRYMYDLYNSNILCLQDVLSGKKLRRFEGHTDSIWSVCFSPDGCYVVSGSEDKTMRLWEVVSGKELRRFEGHTDSIWSVCFSPDGCYVLSGSKDKTVRLWEVVGGKELKRFEGHTGIVNSVCFSPDGRYVLSGSLDKTVRLWEVESGKELRRFEGHTGGVTSICFSPDGRYALSEGGKTIKLWEFDWEWEFEKENKD